MQIQLIKAKAIETSCVPSHINSVCGILTLALQMRKMKAKGNNNIISGEVNINKMISVWSVCPVNPMSANEVPSQIHHLLLFSLSLAGFLFTATLNTKKEASGTSNNGIISVKAVLSLILNYKYRTSIILFKPLNCYDGNVALAAEWSVYFTYNNNEDVFNCLCGRLYVKNVNFCFIYSF